MAAAVGVVVLFVSVFTRAAPDEAGVVVDVVIAALIDCSTSGDGFEPPTPVTGTVVVGAGATVLFVVAGAAAVVGGVAGATVVGVLDVAPLLEVP